MGLSLALAVLAYDALNRRRPTRFALALLAVFIPVLALNSILAHKDSGYAEQFVFSIGHAARTVVAYVAGFSDVFANPFSHKLRYALWAVFTPLAIFGFATNLRKVNPVPALYTALMLGVLALYWQPNMRYLAPLYPIYLLFAALGWNRLMLCDARAMEAARSGGGDRRVARGASVERSCDSPQSGYSVHRP